MRALFNYVGGGSPKCNKKLATEPRRSDKK